MHAVVHAVLGVASPPLMLFTATMTTAIGEFSLKMMEVGHPQLR
jgi:hypothetical protein